MAKLIKIYPYGNKSPYGYGFNPEYLKFLKENNLINLYYLNYSEIEQSNHSVLVNGIFYDKNIPIRSKINKFYFCEEQDLEFLKNSICLKLKNKFLILKNIVNFQSIFKILNFITTKKGSNLKNKFFEWLETYNDIFEFDATEFFNLKEAFYSQPQYFILNYPNSKVNYKNIENLKRIQRELILNKGYISKVSGWSTESVWDIRFWRFNGYSENESKELVSKYQKENSKKCYEKIKNNIIKKPNVYSLDYWINKGFTEEEALEKINQAKKNSRCTLENYIKKYGEEIGLLKYEQKTKNWIETLNKKSEKEKIEILYKRTNFNSCSKISQELFNSIYKEIKSLNMKVYFMDLNHEYGSWIKELNKGVLYDFVIPEIKYAIEFNGNRFHPNKEKLSTEDWNNWKHPFSKNSAKECFNFDNIKNNHLIDKGYKLRIIWEEDYHLNKELIIKNIIKEIKEIYETIFGKN